MLRIDGVDEESNEEKQKLVLQSLEIQYYVIVFRKDVLQQFF